MSNEPNDLNSKNVSLQQNSSVLYFNPTPSNSNSQSPAKARPGNRSFLEFPFFEGDDDISNKMPDESGRSFDLFPPSGSLQPASKLISESSNRNKQSYESGSLLEFESIRRSRPKSATAYRQRPKPAHDTDNGHTTEPFSFVPDPILDLVHEGSVAKVMHTPSSTALEFAQYKTEATQKNKDVDAEKSQMRDFTAFKTTEKQSSSKKTESDGNFQRSASGTVLNKKKFGSIFRSSLSKTVVLGNKDPTPRRPSIFAKLFSQTPVIRSKGPPKRSITGDQLNLINDVSVADAVLRRHGNNKMTGIDLNSIRGNRQPILVSYMMKHASNPKTKEGEVFAKILSRLHPQKFEQLHKKKQKGWRQHLIIRLFVGLIKFFFSVHSPDSAFIISWNFVGLLLVIFNCFYVPFLASFLFSYSGVYITIPLNLFFALDIILSFRTAYYSKGLLISSPKKIIRYNLNVATALDLITLFFGVLYLFNLNNAVLKYLTFITLSRGFKMTTYIQRIEDHFQFGRVVSGILKLVRLVLFIYIVAHVGGCIFYLIGVSQNSSQVLTWLRVYAISYTNIMDVYVMAVYWSFTTMITVGYGDITPQNVNEQIYTIVMMAMAGGVFGYSLNTIGQIVNDVTEASASSREKIRQITKYMKRKRLSRGMQLRVRKYLEYILEGEMVNRKEEQELLKMLSEPLKEEIVAEINVKALMDLRALSLNFSQRFLTKLARELKERMLSPEEYLFRDGASDDHSIYYLTAGNVHLHYERCNKVIKVLNRREFFGEIAFFSNRERTAGAKSVNFSSVFQLRREDFLIVVQDFHTDKETFYNIQDKILYEKDFSNLGIVCFSCQKAGHLSQNCLSYQFFFSDNDKKQAITDFIEKTKEIRGSHKRTAHKRFNPRHNLEKLQNDSIKAKNNELLMRALNDQYDNLSEDSFDEVLDRKIYGKDGKDPMDTAPVIDSLESVEGQANVNSLKMQRGWSQRDSLYPYQPTGSNRIIGSTLGNPNSYPFPMMYSSGAEGSSPDKKSQPMMGSMHFPGSQYFKFPTGGGLHQIVFETVCNYESYYTHGNINVISQKINIPAMERLIQRHFEKKGKMDVPKNTLKAIDILSRGSVFRSIRRESSDSVQAGSKSVKEKTNEIPALTNQDLGDSRRGSILSAFHSSGYLIAGSSEFPNRRPSLFRPNLNSQRGSAVTPQGNGEIPSLMSNGSYIRESRDSEEVFSPGLKPSRFSQFRVENQSPTRKQEVNNAPNAQKESLEDKQAKQPYQGSVSGSAIGLISPSNFLGNPSSSSLNLKKNSGSHESNVSGSVPKISSSQMDNTPHFNAIDKGRQRKNSNNAQRSMAQDSDGTGSEHQTIGGANSNITFQQKNSDDAVSSINDSSTKQILKHLWQAMDRMSKTNTPRRKENSRYRRSNSVGAQSQVEKLLEEFGLREVLQEFLKISTNSALFLKENVA